MATYPLVSVFIPAFNADKTIRQAIDSVLAQTFTNFELILIDDASTDTTGVIIRRYTDHPQIRVYHNAQNLGVAPNWNYGLTLCRGQYIVRLNADDDLAPTYLAQVIAMFEQHPALTFIFTGATLTHPSGKTETELPYPESWVKPGPEFLPEILRRCPIRASGACVRHAAYQALGGVIPEMDIHEDWEMWVRLAANGPVGYLAQPLTGYRVLNPTGATSTAIINARSPIACQLWLDKLAARQLPYQLDARHLALLKQGMIDIVITFAVFARQAGLTESVDRHLAFARQLLPPPVNGSMQARLLTRAAEIHFMAGGAAYFTGWRYLVQALRYGLPPLPAYAQLKLWARAILGKTVFEFIREQTVARRKFPYPRRG
jgi:glycosyltransferase involved in cell wall biosynthesis